MRAFATALALALVLAGCGGAERGEIGSPEPSATASLTAVTPAGTVVVITANPATIAPDSVPPQTIPPAPTPAPTITSSPAPGGLTQAQLKYRLVDRFGRLLFCDPDYYPVARADEQALAHERLPDIQKDAPTFSAILAHLGIAPAATYTSAQELAIYRDWKMLNALRLDSVGAAFHFLAIFGATPQQGTRVDGTIDAAGAISVASQTPSGPPPCPICLARGTRIATPAGDLAVERLRVGDLVWTRDASGARVAAPLMSVGSTPVPPTHQVVHLALADGRAVDVSPGHPTADGRRVGDLLTGDAYDGSTVVAAARVAYRGGATFDILPAGASGSYWADGIPLGSTLR
jgi:hypothetical protein